MLFKFKEKACTISIYEQQINHIKKTLTTIKKDKLIDQQPELAYAELILLVLDAQVQEAENALVERRSHKVKAKIKRLLGCGPRDELTLGYRLIGMVRRVDDLLRELKRGLDERGEDGDGDGDGKWARILTKMEGRTILRASCIVKEVERRGNENENEDEDEKLEDAVEEQYEGIARTVV